MSELISADFKNKTWKREGPGETKKQPKIYDEDVQERFKRAEQKASLDAAVLKALKNQAGHRIETLIELVYKELLAFKIKEGMTPDEIKEIQAQIKFTYPKKLIIEHLDTFK